VKENDFNLGNGVAPKVLLTETTRWAFAARLAIGLAKAGSTVSAVCPSHDPLLKTRAVRQTFHYSGLHPHDSLAAAIEVARPRIIIPCDDFAVQHLHELHARARSLGSSGSNLAALIEYSLGSPESYPIVSARYDLLRIAQEEGLRVPDIGPVHTVDDLRSWQRQHAFPWVLKADRTFGGRGVRIVHTLEQAKRSFLELTRLYSARLAIKRLCVNRDSFCLRPWWNGSRSAISVQSHIRGRPANCAVACWKGKILAGIGVDAVSTEGPTGPASVVRVVDNPEMMLAAERIAGRLGLSGFFGLDFMIEEASGATYLIEMNPRATPVCHLQLGKGRDLVGALCSQLSGQPYHETPPITQNAMIAYFPDAWNCKSEFLRSSFQDVPQGEPDLVQELLRRLGLALPFQELSQPTHLVGDGRRLGGASLVLLVLPVCGDAVLGCPVHGLGSDLQLDGLAARPDHRRV
jgi:hypothetical protein